MTLTGKMRLQLQEVLLDAFPNKAVLSQMLRHHLEFNLEAATGGANLTEVVFNLIERAVAEGWIDKLIEQSRQANPGNEALCTFAENVFQRPARKIIDGLEALPRLMDLPGIRDHLVAFRSDFKAALKRINLMSSYKEFHDLLHELQVHCYDRVVQEAKRFPADDVARENLSDHEITLERIVDQMRKLINRRILAEIETSGIMDFLQRALENLRGALAMEDVKQLDCAISLTDRVLSRFPTLINMRLNSAANELRLSDLVEALRGCVIRLDQIRIDSKEVQQFRAAVDGLERVNRCLIALIDEHDKWQHLDFELRYIENSLRQDASDLIMSWDKLKEMSAPLWSASPDPWAHWFKADSEKLEWAIGEQNLNQVRQCFRRYRRHVVDRFYRADVDLKEICVELRSVGEPLDGVTRTI